MSREEKIRKIMAMQLADELLEEADGLEADGDLGRAEEKRRVAANVRREAGLS